MNLPRLPTLTFSNPGAPTCELDVIAKWKSYRWSSLSLQPYSLQPEAADRLWLNEHLCRFHVLCMHWFWHLNLLLDLSSYVQINSPVVNIYCLLRCHKISEISTWDWHLTAFRRLVSFCFGIWGVSAVHWRVSVALYTQFCVYFHSNLLWTFCESALFLFFIEENYRIKFSDVKLAHNTRKNLSFSVAPVKFLSLTCKVI